MSELQREHLLFETSMLTDNGMVRKNNEDNLLVIDSNEANAFNAESYGIYLVADGMGGHRAGEIASEIAIRNISSTIMNSLKQVAKTLTPSELVKKAIEEANADIYETACGNPELLSMGTTATVGLRLNNRLYLGHVGDSRFYLLRKGKMRQLTEDHSLVARLVKEGVITLEEAKTHPDRSKIFRCLGTSAEVAVDTGQEKLRAGDSLLVCTDGLTGHVSDEEIRDCLQENEAADVTCQKLIHLANLGGGADNISVIVIRITSACGKDRVQKEDVGVRTVKRGFEIR